MTLGINGIRLGGRRSGVGRVIESLLKGLDQVDHPFDRIRVYSPEPLDPAVKLPAAAHNVVLRSNVSPGLWEQVVMPRAHGRKGLLFCPSYAAPFWSGCPVLLVHHGSYEGYPQAFGWWRRTRARAINTMSARRATTVTTVSEHSKRDIIRFYGIPPEKVRVIPDGVDTALFRTLQDGAAAREWRMRIIGEDVPIIVYVGKPTARRNLPALIRAFARLKKDHKVPHHLVLVGVDVAASGLGAVADAVGVSEHVLGIRHASHEEMAVIYNASDMLVYPSSYEGFGMPVLEAMACGTPAIALNNTAFPEFAGGVALLLDDARVETLADGMLRVIEDRDLRETMSTEGPKRAAAYDWRGLTRQYIALMQQTMEIW